MIILRNSLKTLLPELWTSPYTSSRNGSSVPGKGHLAGLAWGRTVQVTLCLHQITIPPGKILKQTRTIWTGQQSAFLFLLSWPAPKNISLCAQKSCTYNLKQCYIVLTLIPPSFPIRMSDSIMYSIHVNLIISNADSNSIVYHNGLSSYQVDWVGPCCHLHCEVKLLNPGPHGHRILGMRCRRWSP